MNFSDLLQLPIACDLLTSSAGAVVVMGDLRGKIAMHGWEARRDVTARVFFGLPAHGSPAPVLMRSLLTERGTRFDDFSLFAWIEENYLAQPRADIVGLMPNGVQPLFFLRDLDLDRPPEAYVREGEAWARVRGVVIADKSDFCQKSDLLICALRLALPNDQNLVDALAKDAPDNALLRAALRARRKTHPPEVLRVCDAWRVLAQAAPLRACDPSDPEAVRVLRETFSLL